MTRRNKRLGLSRDGQQCLEYIGSNVIDRKEYEETMSEISEKLKSLGSGNNNKEVTEIRDIIKSMGKEMSK